MQVKGLNYHYVTTVQQCSSLQEAQDPFSKQLFLIMTIHGITKPFTLLKQTEDFRIDYPFNTHSTARKKHSYMLKHLFIHSTYTSYSLFTHY